MLRAPSVRIALLCLALAACVAPGTAVTQDTITNGWLVVAPSSATRKLTCGEVPVVVQKSHADIALTGDCGYVRVAGEHDDVVIDVAAAGTIEITGQHNDVYWRQTGPGAPPTLLDRGSSNSFHPPRPQG